MKNQILESTRGQLAVSCQARSGWPMEGPEIMAAFAKAAEVGGAAMIRATGVSNIKAIKKKTALPILGINKRWVDGCDIYITPTIEDARAILELGIEMIALDVRPGIRPDNQQINQILQTIRLEYPDVIIVGEIDQIASLDNVDIELIDMISTTLNGYSKATVDYKQFDTKLLEQLVSNYQLPIVAEGKIHTPEQAKQALNAGAHLVVVGTAITIPERITSRFVEEMKL